MKIALDYDGTYTADPDFWKRFLQLSFATKGTEVVIVTFRDDRHDRTPDFDYFDRLMVPVFFTRGIAKKFYCDHFGPGKIDIWIDDKPETIFANSDMTPAALVEWRAPQVAS